KTAGVVHKGEYVFDQDATRRIGPANLERIASGRPIAPPSAVAARGGGGSVNVSVGPTTINAPNADAAGLARLEAMMRQRDAALPTRVVQAVRKAKQSRAL